jgi:hypothetical protein
VEDRQPAGLWLELVRSEPGERAEELAGVGLRVSAWRADPYPEHLPRRIDEAPWLLVGESATAYDSLPVVPETSTAMPMVRYPRPSQGICTGEPTLGLLLVLITPRSDEQAQELRDWGDFVHLRWIAAAGVPGYTTITPYENVTGGSPRFCHFYEMSTSDPRTAYESMTPLVGELLGGGPGNPAYDAWAWHPALRIDYVNTFSRVDAPSSAR